MGWVESPAQSRKAGHRRLLWLAAGVALAPGYRGCGWQDYRLGRCFAAQLV